MPNHLYDNPIAFSLVIASRHSNQVLLGKGHPDGIRLYHYASLVKFTVFISTTYQ